ncbi:DUF4192 family protein [Actinomadura hibisca]|uniref:DUF4192 family protein n=1 Tax=Actinomadura hibisca TaxID=68565 RepID=UPI0008344B85|nr:DUF4192 family protein [Actinomadura hibisca]
MYAVHASTPEEAVALAPYLLGYQQHGALGTGSGPKAAVAAVASSCRGVDSRLERPAGMVRHVVGEDLMWMIAETERAQAELITAGWRRWRRRSQRSGLALELIASSRRLTDREAARLSVVLAHLCDRGEALALLPETETDHRLELWADLTRRAIGRYAAGPAVLLAMTALLHGDRSTAATALERCQDTGHRHTLIPVWGELLPIAWRLLNQRADPEDVRRVLFEDHGGQDGER